MGMNNYVLYATFSCSSGSKGEHRGTAGMNMDYVVMLILKKCFKRLIDPLPTMAGIEGKAQRIYIAPFFLNHLFVCEIVHRIRSEQIYDQTRKVHILKIGHNVRLLATILKRLTEQLQDMSIGTFWFIHRDSHPTKTQTKTAFSIIISSFLF